MKKVVVLIIFLLIIIPLVVYSISPRRQADVLGSKDANAKPTITVIKPTPSHVALPTIYISPTAKISPSLALSPTSSPSATPSPTIVIGPQSLEDFFGRYSSEYNIDKELLKKIAKCESDFNSDAISGDYAGMFQFTEALWIQTRNSMGKDVNSNLRYNAEEAIKTAAYLISQGRSSVWPNCSK